MAKVDGIETPAEKSNFHRAQRGQGAEGRQGSIERGLSGVPSRNSAF